MKNFSKFILKLFGWKMVGDIPLGLQKTVLIEAPHTSNWDYLVGMLCISSKGVKVNVIIKKELFFWPLGPLLRILGGIPLDRSSHSNKVEALADLFNDYDELYLSVTPEGTRSLATNWKKGFYYIALKAKVPILLTAIDYRKKAGFIGPLIYPSGNYEVDLKQIQEFYKGMTAKFPEKFNLSPQYMESSGKNKISDKEEVK